MLIFVKQHSFSFSLCRKKILVYSSRHAATPTVYRCCSFSLFMNACFKFKGDDDMICCYACINVCTCKCNYGTWWMHERESVLCTYVKRVDKKDGQIFGITFDCWVKMLAGSHKIGFTLIFFLLFIFSIILAFLSTLYNCCQDFLVCIISFCLHYLTSFFFLPTT